MIIPDETYYGLPLNRYKASDVFNGIDMGQIFYTYYWNEKTHEYLFLSIDKHNITNYIVELKYYVDGLILPEYDFGPNSLYNTLDAMWADFVDSEIDACIDNPEGYKDVNKFLDKVKDKCMVPKFVFDAFSDEEDEEVNEEVNEDIIKDVDSMNKELTKLRVRVHQLESRVNRGRDYVLY